MMGEIHLDIARNQVVRICYSFCSPKTLFLSFFVLLNRLLSTLSLYISLYFSFSLFSSLGLSLSLCTALSTLRSHLSSESTTSLLSPYKYFFWCSSCPIASLPKLSNRQVKNTKNIVFIRSRIKVK